MQRYTYLLHNPHHLPAELKWIKIATGLSIQNEKLMTENTKTRFGLK
jgi:hypothetical protein